MRITILTICPERFGDFLRSPVIARAVRRGVAEIEIVDIREFARGSFRAVDDSPFGGGAGLILRAGPVMDAVRHARGDGEGVRVVFLSPAGERYSQKKAHELAERYEHVILLCGHYEGIDARAFACADEMLSLGDYILTGGELAAEVVADSVIRLLPGVLRGESAVQESFEDGLLEYPQYTQPAKLMTEDGERSVPEVLLSGNHERIRQWRRKESLRLTVLHRPELVERLRGDGGLTAEDERFLEEITAEGRVPRTTVLRLGGELWEFFRGGKKQTTKMRRYSRSSAGALRQVRRRRMIRRSSRQSQERSRLRQRQDRSRAHRMQAPGRSSRNRRFRRASGGRHRAEKI
ncbi:tRNA (guanosine(37)-N1)-methyltransferase TrmD [Lachnoclostridium sp. Marseille-P6806]|uniref:tRNA (guanosine(37)-N1)-methyltransferase TrmD n=1 Tax=Lachnoclostridium sp. Marseille-P6806 TaxID=2364793 RepID=UPI001030F75E|nr:tRNA (guanosine(37)-N1)-methyltransferase TrmD [Lachnoclostridium sp. Marseille-P6806]